MCNSRAILDLFTGFPVAIMASRYAMILAHCDAGRPRVFVMIPHPQKAPCVFRSKQPGALCNEQDGEQDDDELDEPGCRCELWRLVDCPHCEGNEYEDDND